MKKLLFLVLALSSLAFAQFPYPAGVPYQVIKTSTCGATTCTPSATNVSDSLTAGFPTSDGIGYYRLSWTVDGSFTSCAISLDSRDDQSAAWSTGGIASSGTIGSCTSAGSYTNSTAIYKNFVRATPAIVCSSPGCVVTFTLLGGLFSSSVTGATGGAGTVTSVSGTTNQIDSTGGATPVLSLDSAIILPGTINKLTLTAPATGSTFTLADGKTFTVSNTLTFTGTDTSSVAFGAGGTVLYNGGALGTPSSGTLTNATGLPLNGLANPTADSTLTYPTTSTTGLTFAGTAPVSAGGNGTAASTLFNVNGVIGGATSSTGANTGGTGSSPAITAGAGGAATGVGAANTTVAGAGGSITLTSGAGGNGGAGNDSGGNGGNLALTLGAGGTATGTGTIGLPGGLSVTQPSNTGATNVPVHNYSATWNNAALVGSEFVQNLTCTAAAANSNLFDFQLSSTSQIKFTYPSANCAGTPSLTLIGTASVTAGAGFKGSPFTGGGFGTNVTVAGGLATSSQNGAVGNLLVQGSDNSNTGASTAAGTLTLRAGNLTSTPTDRAGGETIIAGGLGTGAAAVTHVKIQSPALGLASGTTQQSQITRFTTHVKAGSTTSATATSVFNIASATNTAWGVDIVVHVDLISSTPNICGTTQRFSLTGTNNNGAFGAVAINPGTAAAGTLSTLCSTGTLTLAVSATAANPSVVSVTPTWATIASITSATITITVENPSQQEIALL